jgi:hypothetical protein
LDVFLEPDVIKWAGETKRTHLPLLPFEKVIQHKRIVVKEVRTVTSTKKKKSAESCFIPCIKLKNPTNELLCRIFTDELWSTKPSYSIRPLTVRHCKDTLFFNTCQVLKKHFPQRILF